MSLESLRARFSLAVNRQRLVDTAVELVEVSSPTGHAGAAADTLAEILRRDGFAVERPLGGHPAAPAVVARLSSPQPGRTLQFDGHLDTVHLPFVAPAVADGQITGSGAADMKAGLAAAVEALRVLRDTDALPGGTVLLVAHDLHEAPWGLGQQLNELISAGLHGDAVLIPEPLCETLPIAGRGAATWKVTFLRQGAAVHEVMRPADEPSVIAAGAHFVDNLAKLSRTLTSRRHPIAGSESVFIGQIHSGEIYNQYPQSCWLEGTRRWLPDSDAATIEEEFRALALATAKATGTSDFVEWRPVRGAFALDLDDPLVTCFQAAYASHGGADLPTGAKPFVDDGNSFWAIAHVPAITHGPRAGGQHTVNEWVSIDDLVRVAQLYALVATLYCPVEQP
jgi:acetylornithine deacetylase/succinyl-diaminopimelate desuccinylase-like protein